MMRWDLSTKLGCLRRAALGNEGIEEESRPTGYDVSTNAAWNIRNFRLRVRSPGDQWLILLNSSNGLHAGVNFYRRNGNVPPGNLRIEIGTAILEQEMDNILQDALSLTPRSISTYISTPVVSP